MSQENRTRFVGCLTLVDEEPKLYAVEVVVNILVLARTLPEAEKLARKNAGEEVSDNFGAFACEVKTEGDIPEEWRDSIPYGEERDRSCAQIMADQLCRAQAREHERKLKEAEAAHPTLGLEEK